MSARTTIERVATHADARGLVFEPLGAEALADKRNVHVVLTAPGAIRGNHRHRLGTEIAVVAGPAEVRLREDGELRELLVPAGETWRFTIPPGVAHAYRNPGPGLMLLIGFNTEPHDPAAPDALREELY